MSHVTRRRGVLSCVLTILSAAGCEQPERYEILVTGGTVIDGTGAAGALRELGIREGQMFLLEPGANADAPDTIDATGLVVSPGFVDVHSHTPMTIAEPEKKLNEGFIRQGVTTVVGGPDGYHGPQRLRELIEAYEENGVGTNVAFYVGHNGVRREVMGDDQRRPPTAEELDEMKSLVREGMELGALGLSTGLMYEPGMFSETDEVVELAKEVAPFGGIYDSHVRDPAREWIASNREAIEIGERAGIPVKLGHLKEVGLHNEGLTPRLIAMVEEARARGVEVVADQYPYDAAAGRLTLQAILVVSGDPRENRRLKDDPEFDLRGKLRDPGEREKIRESTENGVDGGFAWIKAIGYTSIRIVASEDYPELVGKFLSEIAYMRGVPGFEVVSELILGAEHPVEIKGGIQEQALQALIVQPWNMVASDGAYVDGNSEGQGHPRSTGTFPRVLGHYVRELELMSLEEAVVKMTSFPAEFVGLESRGRLADGLPADIAIFDPGIIIDHSTYVEPNRFSEGVVHVLVNGVPVLQDGELTGEAPGKFLSRER